jgi:predicted Zn-dependent protease
MDMTKDPRNPDEMSTPPVTSNEQDKRPRAWAPAAWLAAWVVLGIVLPLAGNGQVQLPDFGDPSATVLSPADEREIGKLFMREVRAQLVVVDDPEVEEYIQSLGYRLVSGGTQGDTGFYFFVVADGAINAFAAPGGYIGVNSGLFIGAQSESELASVVAHEISHVTQHHIARAIALQDRSRWTNILGMLAAIAVGAADAQAGAAAAAAVSAAGVQQQLNFTRANEKEADRVGIAMLANSGYDPRAMPIFFERLQTASRYYSRPPEFLSTHPVTTNRISDSRSRAEQYPYKQFIDSDSFGLVRMKLHVITAKDPKHLLADIESKLPNANEKQRRTLLYGKALVLAKMEKNEEALAVFKKLVEMEPDRVSFRVALAKTELRAGDPDVALALFDDTYSLFPDNRQVVRGYVDALLRQGQSKRALLVIEDYSRINALDAAMYRLAAEAYQQSDRVIDSRMAMAEHYYLTGELGAAINQLQLAQRDSSGDYYRNSRIEARLQELEREKRSQENL